MAYFIKKINVEDQIKVKFNMSAYQFLDNCLDQEMTIGEVAIMLDCSVSNLRRIARKYNFKFSRPLPQPKYIECSDFKMKAINKDNILSRSWVSVI
jgi:hypothetical protein